MRAIGLIALTSLLAVAPAAGQDTSSVASDRQLRQRLDFAVARARSGLAEDSAQLAHLVTARAAVHARIIRDSLRAIPREDTVPIFADGFEGGVLKAVSSGVGWDGSRNVAVSTANPHTGLYALRAVYPATAPRNPPAAEQSFILPNLREVWVEWYVFIPPDWSLVDEGGPDNKKWFLMKDADVGGAANAVAVYLEYDTTPEQQPGARLLVKYEVDEGAPEYAWKTTPVPDFLTAANRGKWVQMRVHVRLATTRTGARTTATGDGVIQVWRDGQLLYENTSAPLLAQSPALSARNYLGYGYFLGAANKGFPQETVYDLDDVSMYAADPGWR